MTSQELSLENVWLLCRRYWVFLTIFIMCMVGATTIGVYVWPETYEVTASLFVKIGREQAAPATVPSGQTFLGVGKRAEDIASEIEIIRSQYLVEKVVDALGIDFFLRQPPPPTALMARMKWYVRRGLGQVKEWIRDALVWIGFEKPLSERNRIVLGLHGGLEVESARKADVIEIRLRTTDPEGGAEVVNRLIDLYLDHRTVVHATPGIRRFFDEQAELLRSAVKEAEEARRALKERHAVGAFDEHRTLLLRHVRELAVNLQAVDAEMEGIAAQLGALRERLVSLPREVRLSQATSRNSVLDSLRWKLAELEIALQRALTRFTPESRTVRELEREIAEVQERIRGEEASVMGTVTSGLNPAYQALEQEADQLQARAEGLRARQREQRAQLAKARHDLRAVDGIETELKRLDRRLAIAEEGYLLYMRKREEARASEAMDQERIANVSVIALALPPLKPIRPKKLLLLGIALAVSPLVGVTLIAIMNYGDQSLRDSDDVEMALDLRLLASIPDVKPLRRA